jgi:Fe-S-cluster containining protein
MPPGYLVPSLLTFLPESLREELERHQAEEEATGWTRHERGLPCIWLDPATKLCRHYELRPERCRVFPTGGEGCAFWRARRPLEPGTGAARSPDPP